MHPEQRLVKFATALLPFLCFAVERRVKNKFCLPLTKENINLKFLLRKENVRRTVCSHRGQSGPCDNNSD
jgi:hypothetical protein